jgi:hypothetical protein
LSEPHQDAFLISRVLSLIPMNIEVIYLFFNILKKEIKFIFYFVVYLSFNQVAPWRGPVDQDLMAFNSIVKALYRSLRNLVDILLLNLYLQSKSIIHPRSYIIMANQ